MAYAINSFYEGIATGQHAPCPYCTAEWTGTPLLLACALHLSEECQRFMIGSEALLLQ